MTLEFEPGDIGAVRRHLQVADPQGLLAPCGIDRVILGRDCIRGLSSVVRGVVGANGSGRRPKVVLLVDETPILRTGEDLKSLVEAQLQADFDFHKCVLSDGHPVLHASETVLEEATGLVVGADVVVTIGGGTMTDIGKVATHSAGDIPHVAVQTAASVDGFTDNVSVILRDGVKRTVPSRWPTAVVSDTETISGAPPEMNRAGYGELISMFTAPADWRLASLLGVDTTFHPATTELLAAAGHGIEKWSPGVGRAEPEAVERLTWALAVRGIVTGVAGTTACLSGVEHLVSHMLDLYHGQRGMPTGLHGAQVGVASILAAAAWEMMFERAGSGGVHLAKRWRLPDPANARRSVSQAFSELDPSGKVEAECWRDYEQKLHDWERSAGAVFFALENWDVVRKDLMPLAASSRLLATGLKNAGSAYRFDQLTPAVTDDLVQWALRNCGLMRNRTTVVDLLTFLGWWGPSDVEEVMSRAAEAWRTEVRDDE